MSKKVRGAYREGEVQDRGVGERGGGVKGRDNKSGEVEEDKEERGRGGGGEPYLQVLS